jgi:DNA-binding NtrC family response regulator
MVIIFDSLCQRIRAVGLVLWIDSNTFATGLLEKVFKKRDIPFYTLEKASDFSYLVEDLRPEVLVLDFKTANEHIEALEKQYQNSQALQQLPVIFLDEAPEMPFIQKRIGQINRPFDPFKIPDIIQNILKNN